MLEQLGYKVTWKEYPMPHSVCAEEIRDISAFLGEGFVATVKMAK